MSYNFDIAQNSNAHGFDYDYDQVLCIIQSKYRRGFQNMSYLSYNM